MRISYWSGCGLFEMSETRYGAKLEEVCTGILDFINAINDSLYLSNRCIRPGFGEVARSMRSPKNNHFFLSQRKIYTSLRNTCNVFADNIVLLYFYSFFLFPIRSNFHQYNRNMNNAILPISSVRFMCSSPHIT